MSETIVGIFLIVFFAVMMTLIVAISISTAKLDHSDCADAGGILVRSPSRVNTYCIKAEAILNYE